MVIRAKVHAKAVGQPRGRAVNRGGRAFIVSAFKGHPVLEFKAAVRNAVFDEFARAGAAPFDWATLTVDCFVARPKSHLKADGSVRASASPFPTKPDVDNVLKAVMDALNGVAYPDDARLTAVSATCRYSDDQTDWVDITVSEVSP
jgi:Holliday junction resolvase RusA-like endonuclease